MDLAILYNLTISALNWDVETIYFSCDYSLGYVWVYHLAICFIFVPFDLCSFFIFTWLLLDFVDCILSPFFCLLVITLCFAILVAALGDRVHIFISLPSSNSKPLPRIVCWRNYSFPLKGLGILTKHQLHIDVLVYFCTLSAILLVCMHVSVYMYLYVLFQL